MLLFWSEKLKRIGGASFDTISAECALVRVEFRDSLFLVPSDCFVFTGIEAFAAVDAAGFAALPA